MVYLLLSHLAALRISQKIGSINLRTTGMVAIFRNYEGHSIIFSFRKTNVKKKIHKKSTANSVKCTTKARARLNEAHCPITQA